MRVVVQRVASAHVEVEQQVTGSICIGLLVLVGITHEDDQDDIEWLVKKLTGLRIFNDGDGKMNLDIREVNGDFLVVSQFTLHASTRKGNRPSYIEAAHPDKAIRLYDAFIQRLLSVSGRSVASGIFGADMNVHLINQGPVTIIMDSKQKL